jgi:hypothetical protein
VPASVSYRGILQSREYIGELATMIAAHFAGNVATFTRLKL